MLEVVVDVSCPFAEFGAGIVAVVTFITAGDGELCQTDSLIPVNKETPKASAKTTTALPKTVVSFSRLDRMLGL